MPVLVQAFDLGGFVPPARQSRAEPAGDREGGGGAARRQLLPDLPGGNPQPDWRLLPFKKGGFVMAIKGQRRSSAAIKGAREAMRKGSFGSVLVAIDVRFGEPVETRG